MRFINQNQFPGTSCSQPWKRRETPKLLNLGTLFQPQIPRAPSFVYFYFPYRSKLLTAFLRRFLKKTSAFEDELKFHHSQTMHDVVLLCLFFGLAIVQIKEKEKPWAHVVPFAVDYPVSGPSQSLLARQRLTKPSNALQVISTNSVTLVKPLTATIDSFGISWVVNQDWWVLRANSRN